MPTPQRFSVDYDPLVAARYNQQGQLVDGLTGQPIAMPATGGDPLVSPQAVVQPQAQQPQPIDVGAWEKQNDVYNKSSVKQRELFNQFVDQQYADWVKSNPGSAVSKDVLASQLAQGLTKGDNNYILNTKGPEGNIFRDIPQALVSGATGLVSAGGGLINAATSAVTGPNQYTAALAEGADKLDKGAEGVGSAARQDFHKQRDEILADKDKGLADLADLYISNPLQGGLDLASVIGMGWGSGAVARGALRGGERALAAGAARGAAERAAGELGANAAGQAAVGRTAAAASRTANAVDNTETLNRAANILGQGGLGAGLGAQSMGAQQGDYELSRGQSLGAGIDGVVAALATGIGMRYGHTPESLLLGATTAKVAPDAIPSLMRTALQSAGVEATSNAVQSAADAAITTGFDKDGNLDLSKIDWSHVAQAAKLGGALGGVTGGGAGLVAGVRGRRAAPAEDTVPDEALSTTEQRAADDNRHLDVDPVQQANPLDALSGRANPQDAFMDSPAFRDYLDNLRNASEGDATGAVTPFRPPLEGELVDPLVSRAPAGDTLTGPAAEPTQAVGRAPGTYEDFVDTARKAYDGMTPYERESSVQAMKTRVEGYANDPETLAARQRELDRQQPDYVETNPAQSQADQVRLTMLDGMRRAQAELEQHHQLRTNSALAYSEDAPTGPVAQSIIDDRIAEAATPWTEVPTGTGAARRQAQTAANAPALAQQGIQGADPRTVVEARRMMSDYQKTPDGNKAGFVDRVNQANQHWFTRAYDPADGRTFDQLAYDAEHLPDATARGRAQQLYTRAQSDAERRVRLSNLLNEEHRAWTEADNARRETLARDVNAVPEEALRNVAAESVLGATDPKALREAKIAGVSALKAMRAATVPASEKAKSGVKDSMRSRLDRDMLGEQRGSTQFMKTAAELTGAPTDRMKESVGFLRDQNALAYGKEAVVRNLANYEADPGASGRTRNNTTSYLNYLQGKQDAITQAIGEWRPLSMEDVRNISGGLIPELARVGEYTGSRDQIKNTRRYVNRVVNEKINSGDYTGDAAARLRLLRDWLIADQSEASYQTPVEARAANGDIPNVRQLRTINDGDLLPSGKPGEGDPLHEPVPEIRAAVAEGSVSDALGRAVLGLPPLRQVVMQALKTIVDKARDPIRTRISESKLTVNGRDVPAYFDREAGEIVVHTDYADRPDIIAHEAVHAVTHEKIDDGLAGRLSGTDKRAYDNLYALWREAVETKSDMPDYGKTNLHEFVAESMSNPAMQDFLKSYSSANDQLPKMRNMYNSFVGAVRSILGLPPKSFTALDDVIGLTKILAVGPEAAGSKARVVESKGLQSGILSRYVQDGDTSVRQDIGRMQRLEDGTFSVETDADSPFGRSENSFDTFADAQAFVNEQYGAEVRELSQSMTAPDKHFISRAGSSNPAVSAIARSVEQALGRYLPEGSQDFIGKVVQTIYTGGNWIASMVDRYDILNRLDNALQAAGVPSHLYRTFEDTRTQNKALNRMGSELHQLQVDIGDKLRPIGKTAADLGRFMYALHGQERNAKYGWKAGAKGDVSGFRYTDNQGNALEGVEAIDRYLAELSPRDRQVFEQTSQLVWSQWQRVLQEEQRSGVLSYEQYRRLGGLDENGEAAPDAYRHYVPLRNEEDLAGWLMPQQGVSGRATEATDPFTAMMIQLQQRMGNVYRNDAMRELASVLRTHKIPEVSAMESYKLRYDKNGQLEALPEHVRNFKNAAYWVDDGVLQVIHINDKTTDGKYLLKALRSQGNMNQNALMRGIGAITHYMAISNTTLNPAFQLKQLAWDITTTLLNYQGAYGSGLTASQGAKLALQTVLRAGKLLPQVAADRFQNRSNNPAYNLFGKLGGGMGAGAFMNQSNIERAVTFDGLTNNRAMIEADGLLKGSAKVGKGYLDAAMHMLHSSDDAMRFAGFVEYLQHFTGKDISTMSDADLQAFVRQNPELIDQGIRGSKEISGNFERQGNGGMLHTLYAFWNATMQGSKLFASIASSRQGQYGMMALLAMGAASAFNGMSDPDDDDGAGGSKYAATRNRKTSILLNDEYAVPLAYEARLPYVLGNSGALFMSGKLSAGALFGDVLKSMGEIFSPINPLDSGDAGFDLLYASMPTAAQLAFPMFLGRTAFNTSTDAEFVTGPDGKRVYNPMPVETAKPNTSTLARLVAEGLDTVGLGSVAYPGRIDETIKAAGGGAYRLVDTMLNPKATTITEGRNPLSAALFKDYYAQPDDYQMQTQFKELQQKYDYEFRRQTGSDHGQDILSGATLKPVNKAAGIEKQVHDRQNAIRIGGRDRAGWQAQLEKAKQASDEGEVNNAKVALYQLQQRRNQVYAWGIQELRKLDGE